jgi:hypothetical protein
MPASSPSPPSLPRPPLRYVVLRHEGVDEPHFDLMFETAPGSDLATWRSPVWPLTEATPVTQLRDHRRAYLDYEGLVAGERGNVYRIAEGTCLAVREPDGSWMITLLDRPERPVLMLSFVDPASWMGKLMA